MGGWAWIRYDIAGDAGAETGKSIGQYVEETGNGLLRAGSGWLSGLRGEVLHGGARPRERGGDGLRAVLGDVGVDLGGAHIAVAE